MPRIALDYIEGAAGAELGLRRNRAAFDAVALAPRYLTDVGDRSTEVGLFGRRFDVPIGVAPVGLANVAWPGLDLMMARAAKAANAPYILSTIGTTGLEPMVEAIGEHLWFQLYAAQDEEVSFDLLRRARAAGVDVLVVTVDVPVFGKRDRDIRNGLQLPPTPSVPFVVDVLRHPRWLLANALARPPVFHDLAPTLAPYTPPGASALSMATYATRHVTDRLDTTGLERLRAAWPGRLVIKGIMDTWAAERAAALGADGVIVSNHGARQFDGGPAPIEVLSDVHTAVGHRVSVMMDGGVRSGVDILRAFALGAKLVFSGRSFVFGAAAGGQAGAAHAFAIFKDDVHRGLAQLGATRVDQLVGRAWKGSAATSNDGCVDGQEPSPVRSY